jgi:hypothetical protein
VHSYSRGHKIIQDGNGDWVYEDTKKKCFVPEDKRACKKCGREPTPEGHDACLGHIDWLTSACCGHGVTDPWPLKMKKEIHDKIPMLTQPLTTEEGFLNEACMNELNAAILNIPETHKRLKDDPEWMTPQCISDIDILGALADSAIKCFGGAPPNLEAIVNYTKVELRTQLFKETCDGEADRFRLTYMSLCQINKFLWDILGELDIFIDWNDSNKYKNWIDTSAVLHNVCIAVRNDRRHFVAFNEKFDREYKEG